MTRAELYSLVWELPLVQLAKRFGISNARLKKICQDYEIPVPPAGHWAKRAAGKPIERPGLPGPTTSIFGKLNYALRRIGEIPLKIADSQIDEFDIKFPTGLHDVSHRSSPAELHHCAERLRQLLAAATADDDGFVAVSDPALPIVRTSPDLIGRTALLVDALIGVVQRRGHEVVHANASFRIVVADEIFELKLYETRQRIGDHSRASELQPVARRRFRASGKLCMEIVDPREFQWSNRNLVGQWHDRRDKPLEAGLHSAVDAMEAAAEQIRYCRGRAHEQERLARDERESLRIAATKAQRARHEAEFLERGAAAYTKLVELKQFVAFLKSTGASSNDGTIARMIRRLSALIDEIENGLAPEQLASEARRFDLFLGDD